MPDTVAGSGGRSCSLAGQGRLTLRSSAIPVLSHRYYINLCQKIYKGPLDCSDRASICKKSATGIVQALGLVHTQKLDVVGKALGPCARSQVTHESWEGEGVLVGRWLRTGFS